MWNKLLLAAVVLSSFATEAKAFTTSHQYHTQNRPLYTRNVYFSQQVQFEKSRFNLATSTAGLNLTEDTPSKAKPVDFSGYALRSGVGVEHFRFLQTGVFYSNLNSSQSNQKRTELRGHEVGAETAVVLVSPVGNLSIGGGYFMSFLDYNTLEKANSFKGNGWEISAQAQYFVARNVNLVASAKRLNQSFSSTGSIKTESAPTLESTRLGVGVSVWL